MKLLFLFFIVIILFGADQILPEKMLVRLIYGA